MRILIIHHLEPIWESGYKRFGTSFEEQAEKVVEHLQENTYDLVNLIRFEENKLSEEHYEAGLNKYVDNVFDYAYGWEAGSIDGKEGVDWAIGGIHSEIVLLEDWMRHLKGHEVDLCGAFDGECVEDIEIALEAVGVEYRRLEHLIV